MRLPGRSWRELDNRYGPFTTLIIDIEGSELDVFEASRDLLQKYRLVIAELHPWAIGEAGVHGVQRGMLTISNVTEAGTVYTTGEIAALTAVAKTHNLPCHLDGARFANAIAATNASPAG